MKHRLHKILKPIKETQLIRGIELPVGLEFRQLVVTGPPGAGKTHYINQIGGWPNEGYLDLSRRGWWRDQTLMYRPREIHLGLPYRGFKEPLTVFDQEWLDAPPDVLRIDYPRVRIPPKSQSPLLTNWRDRYIFEFIIPDSELVYGWRRSRQKDGYFPVDANLSMDVVERQIETYSAIALYLHRAGLNVYIREDLHDPPMLISEKGDVALPPWAVADISPRSSLKTLDGWKDLILRQGNAPWFTVTNEIQQLTEASRIPHDGKSLDIIIGRMHLRLTPELPLGASKRYLRQHKNWVLRKPESCSDRTLRGFARISPGETIFLGRSNKDYDDLFGFKKDVGKRHVSITNMKGDLFVRPLDEKKPVRLVRLDEQDNREQLRGTRVSAMLQARSLLGGSISVLSKRSALALVLEVNEILAEESFRPRDKDDLPGGLVELPDDLIPVIVGDLHGQVDNLLKILTENCLLQALQDKSAILCILGDAVHSENAQELEDMESSILIMDLILSLKRKFPAQIFYLRGNHDDFDPELSKQGIPQGLLLKQALDETRTKAYVEAMQTFYDRLPYMIVSNSFIAAHAGPPRVGTSRKQIVNIRQHSKTARELTRNRLKRPNYLSGYGKGEIKSLRKELKAAKSTPVIVGHTPLDPFGMVWQNVGAIKNHHIVYSAHQKGPAYFIRIKDTMIPLSYPNEPLAKLINEMKHTT
jgi:hypothetical protein